MITDSAYILKNETKNAIDALMNRPNIRCWLMHADEKGSSIEINEFFEEDENYEEDIPLN